MKNIFNKLKDTLDALTGNTCNYLEITRKAIKDASSKYYFADRDGALKYIRAASDEFKYNVHLSFTSAKKSVVFEAVIKAAPDSEYASMTAKFHPSISILKPTVKDDQPCLTAVFDRNILTNLETYTKQLQQIFENIESTLEEFAVSLDLYLVNPTNGVLRAALKGMDNVVVSTPVPAMSKVSSNGVIVTVKAPGLNAFHIRLGLMDGDIYYLLYLLNINGEIAVKHFKAQGLKAIALEHQGVKAYGQLTFDDFQSFSLLRKALTTKITAIIKSLHGINSENPLTNEQLFGKRFDCWEIESALLNNKYFKKYEEPGIISLIIPSVDSVTDKKIQVEARILPTEISITSTSEINIPKSGEINAKLVKLAKDKGLTKISYSDGHLQVSYIETPDHYVATPSGYVGLPYVMKNAMQVFEIWPELLKTLGVSVFKLNAKCMKAALKSIDLKTTEVTDNHAEIKNSFYELRYYVKRNDFSAHINRTIESGFSKVLDECVKQIKDLDSRIIEPGLVRSGSNYAMAFSVKGKDGSYSSADDFSSDFKNIWNLVDKVDDIILEYNKKANAILTEENRRKREAEIAAAREKELNKSFTYTLRPGGTIRQLQESFTEDYPYLRIGVYMVKTGQKADRSGGTITPYSSDTTFSQIRSFKGECKVRIEGRSTPQSLEKQFRDISGLTIKICGNDESDNRFYIPKDSYNYKNSIFDINKEYKKAGYYKADIS